MNRRDVLLCSLLASGCSRLSNARSIPLGKSTLLKKDVSYTVADTDVVVTNRGARMASALVNGDPNKETHVFSVQLEVSGDGAPELLDVSDGAPRVAKGLRFSADPQGFEWGKGDGAVLVERAPR